MADTVNRNFAMSYADLIGICTTIHNCMVRDNTEFTGYGVTPLITTAFHTKIDDFLNLPTDSDLSSDVVIATQEKSTVNNDLKIMLRSFATRAKIAFGDNSGKYDKFTIRDLSRLNDNDLIVFAEKVARNAVEYLADLAAAGVTQALIDDLDDKITEFKAAKDAQDDAIMNRDAASNNRIKKANELYGLLINYSDVGKTVWYETNEAYYNDFVIYAPGAGSLTPPENLRFFFGSTTFFWDVVEHATSYSLECSSDGVDFIEIFAGSETEFAYTPQSVITYLRVRARNSNGFGPYSNVLEQGYYAVLPPPSHVLAVVIPGNQIRVTWDLVPSATQYGIFQSIVDSGQPAGSFLNMGYEPSNTHLVNAVSGKRYYFQITAESSVQWSVRSGSVFVDVV
jgi:hypothetical protein